MIRVKAGVRLPDCSSPLRWRHNEPWKWLQRGWSRCPSTRNCLRRRWGCTTFPGQKDASVNALLKMNDATRTLPTWVMRLSSASTVALPRCTGEANARAMQKKSTRRTLARDMACVVVREGGEVSGTGDGMQPFLGRAFILILKGGGL
jgi:hypothetical protein